MGSLVYFNIVSQSFLIVLCISMLFLTFKRSRQIEHPWAWYTIFSTMCINSSVLVVSLLSLLKNPETLRAVAPMSFASTTVITVGYGLTLLGVFFEGEARKRREAKKLIELDKINQELIESCGIPPDRTTIK